MYRQLSLPTERITWTIQQLVELNREGKLVINREYQRSEVWPPAKKQLLIDSILSDYDIGSIILRQKGDNKWEILDGQQRLNAIFDFIKGGKDAFPLKEDTAEHVGGKHWDELGPDVQWGRFMNRQVYTTKIYSVDDETTSQIFLRVQEGMPLNSAERLNAMRGKLRNEIVEISKHPFFTQTRIPPFRFAYRYLCAQIALQEKNSGVSQHNFQNAKFRNLKKLYEEHKATLPPNVFSRISSTFNFLQKTLKSNAQIIRQKGDLLTVYTVASYIMQSLVIKGKEDKFRDFIVELLQNVETVTSTDTEGYYEYWVARSSSPDSKGQIYKRFRIALEKFLEYAPTMEPKDVQRGFDWGQKLAIYAKAYRQARDHGRKESACKICGNPTPFDEGEPDHIKPHNLGGLTAVENGQWTCVPCNRAKSDTYVA